MKNWEKQNAQWRDPIMLPPLSQDASFLEKGILDTKTQGDFWKILNELAVTLLITREYEHLVLAISAEDKTPKTSYLRLPHPSGLAVDRKGKKVFVASTRNPNQIFELGLAKNFLPRTDIKTRNLKSAALLPKRSWFLPGCLYLHDLAFIGVGLFGNAVGENSVVSFDHDGNFTRRWAPDFIKNFCRNEIQLNSIAAGQSLEESFFSASEDKIVRFRPGHPKFRVDGTGVIFSGASGKVVARGLTRPHSARLHQKKLWVCNSGYGELSQVNVTTGEVKSVCRLPGWTRGLTLIQNYALVGTSRVIPRFRQYAPGLDVRKSRCGLHFVNLKTGLVEGSLFWPQGNQIFALDWVSHDSKNGAIGLPFRQKRNYDNEKKVFYSFSTLV